MSSSPTLRFALPPSLGWAPVKEIALQFANMLYRLGFDTVIPFRAYRELDQALMNGEVDAAWGPPAICARAVNAGGSVILRAIRNGDTSYCSALLSASYNPIDLKRLAIAKTRPLRAAWVDRWSMAGYLLPRFHLRSFGMEPAERLTERFFGSYQDCMRALADGECDITATMAARPTLSQIKAFDVKPSLFHVIGFTESIPNDGLVVSPRIPEPARVRITEALRNLVSDPDESAILKNALDVGGFDVPAAEDYAAIQRYLVDLDAA